MMIIVSSAVIVKERRKQLVSNESGLAAFISKHWRMPTNYGLWRADDYRNKSVFSAALCGAVT